MSLISHLRLKKDEDFPAIKKKKSRNPKPRDKWSLLWFIPSNVLNMREETTDGKGQTVKKGKRQGFDTFNQLGCKVCRKAFHKYQSLAFHTREDHGNMNPAGGRSNASWNNVGSRSLPTPVASKRNSLELKRTFSEPSRKSSRLSIKPISYDDEIEILEVDDTPYKSKKPVNQSTAKEFDEKKFAKLTLSAKRKIVEEYNNREEEEELENKKVPAAKKVQAKKYVKPNKNKTSKAVDEIEIIDIDDDEPCPREVDTRAKPYAVEITKMEDDEELLLAEDDDIMNEISEKKRKPINKLQTPNLKKVKLLNNAEKSDMVEVKSSSGKSMFVNKATLEKIMASKALKKTSADSERSSLDEKLLAEKSDLDVTKKKSHSAVSYSKLSPKRTRRSRGV